MLHVLQANQSVFLCESDAVWLRDPTSILEGMLVPSIPLIWC